MKALKQQLARPIEWLLTTREPLPPAIRTQLESGLYTTLPIFLGGVFNSIAIAAIAAWRQPTDLFITWLLLELIIALVRLPVVIWGRRAVRLGRRPPVGLTMLLSCAWSGSVGFGMALSLTSGDWVLSSIVCLSAAAMVCGICLRNFGTPRLAAVMVLLMMAPSAVVGAFTSESVVAIISVQLPVFMITIGSAAFSFHRLLVSRMIAVSDLQRSESFNRSILESSPDYTLVLDEKNEIVFCNRPDSGAGKADSLIGADWLSLIPPEQRGAAREVLAAVAGGKSGNLVTSYVDDSGNRQWFDIVVNRVSDDTGRFIVVARDITHQKNSEEKALWMAHHDPLTRLPNRAVLQDRLDALLRESHGGATGALLIVDVDNFKTINDTLGHDAGDALLCEFARRLRGSLAADDLVARTGGDEFAVLIRANSQEDVLLTAHRIYTALERPFLHNGQDFQCGASIGASLLPRDGSTRSEIMKAADIALYAAKASGRAHLKVFEPSMKAEVERREAMIASARLALEQDRIRPYFQPKVSLRTSEIVGFEALLRWTDADGVPRGPDDLAAAFEDSVLGGLLSDRMTARTLDQMREWQQSGVPFGHVALNVTAADFRREEFTPNLLQALADRGLPPSLLQIEVTETLFLGRGADHVQAALGLLSEKGVRIALDDFGTGYASLSHLSQFPVDLLKIDRSFVGGLGQGADADAISAAVINLGHCLGLEVVAEGVETAAQEAVLVGLGCDGAQGFLYSEAMAAERVPFALADWKRLHRAHGVADAA